MKNYVKAMKKDGEGWSILETKFPKINEPKLQEGRSSNTKAYEGPKFFKHVE